MTTSKDNIFAAGDIATFPYWQTGEKIRIEHYTNAQEQGAYAAYNMMGKMIPYGNIPFFWTRNYNKSIASVGYNYGYNEFFVDGDINSEKFLAYYAKDNKILAVTAMNRGQDLLFLQEAMQQNLMPSASDLKSGKETVASIKSKVLASKGGKCKKAGCCQKRGTSSK